MHGHNMHVIYAGASNTSCIPRLPDIAHSSVSGAFELQLMCIDKDSRKAPCLLRIRPHVGS